VPENSGKGKKVFNYGHYFWHNIWFSTRKKPMENLNKEKFL